MADADAPAPDRSPKTNETGFAMHNDYPANHRLRAEALATDGKDEDPDGEVTPELIADAKARLAADAEEADRLAREEAAKRSSLRWSREDLVTEASRLGLTIESDANKPSILDAINAAQAANTEA